MNRFATASWSLYVPDRSRVAHARIAATPKRLFDLSLATLALAMLSPLLLLVALAIKLESKGPILFSQTRYGWDNRPFRIRKFRTMWTHLGDVSGVRQTVPNDPRVTPLGAFLRKTNIDELPQLFNVLKGDMSLVGPRPALPCEVAHYDAFARRRLTVPQGITCLWQVNGRSEVSFEHWMELDNHYVDTWSPLGDLVLIGRTIPAVLRKDGAH